MIRLVFHSDIDYLEDWRPVLGRLLPNLECSLATEVGDPESIDIALIWKPPPEIKRYRNLKAILSLGAGIDQLDLSQLPSGVPLARLKDPELTNAMRHYCHVAVLRYHRKFDLYERLSQAGGPWHFEQPKATHATHIGMLGLGVAAAARDLVRMGFTVSGWSRNAKDMQGVECFKRRPRGLVGDGRAV